MVVVCFVIFCVYKIVNDWFGDGKWVLDFESYFQENDKCLFVEWVCQVGVIVKEVSLIFVLKKGDEVVLSGWCEYVIGEEDWIGFEVLDLQLLDFFVEVLFVMVICKMVVGEKVSIIWVLKFMYGVSICCIKWVGIDILVLVQIVVDVGDMVELVGIKYEVDVVVKQLGYVDWLINQIDMIFVGLGILIGGLIGVFSIYMGGVFISFSISGGVLIGGLFFGWLCSKYFIFGCIFEFVFWILDNVGLNMFIVVVGIVVGFSFV